MESHCICQFLSEKKLRLLEQIRRELPPVPDIKLDPITEEVLDCSFVTVLLPSVYLSVTLWPTTFHLMTYIRLLRFVSAKWPFWSLIAGRVITAFKSRATRTCELSRAISTKPWKTPVSLCRPYTFRWPSNRAENHRGVIDDECDGGFL